MKTRPAADAAALRTIAAWHGYTSTSKNPMSVGQGSPDLLIDAIIKGEIATVLLSDEGRTWAVGWLREHAATLDDLQREALEGIAAQLEYAALRERENDE